MLLRLSVSMYVSAWVVFIVLTAMSMALSYTLRMFGYPSSLSDICKLLLGLYTPEPVVLPIICPYEFLEGGINDPSVYMQCCRLNLSGYM